MKKLRTVLVIVLLIATLVGYDYYRSKQFSIEVVEITPQPAFADGQSPVHLKLRLLDKAGSPVEGHHLYAIPLNGGLFSAARTATDADGEVVYKYFPYKATRLSPAKNVLIEVRDESNSVFIEINTKKTIEIELLEPETETKSSHSLDAIFGE